MRIEPTLYNLVMNHGFVVVIGFSLLAILSMAAAFLYLSIRHCRNGAGQMLLFLYSLCLMSTCVLMMFGFYQAPLLQSPASVRMTCVAVSVSTHCLILLSFGILACYGVHLVYRVRPPGLLPNLFVLKSVLPTLGIAVALPIALAVVKPTGYVDDFACCFPRDSVASYALFLPIAMVMLSNFIILTSFPYFYAPSSLPGCCRRNDGRKLDWSPVYTPWGPNTSQQQLQQQQQIAQQDPHSYEFNSTTVRPTCLHALAILGLGFLEGGLLIMFYLANFTPALYSPDPHAPPSTNPETRSYHISFLVLAFLLGISLLLEMVTLEDETLHACKTFCLGHETMLAREEQRLAEQQAALAAAAQQQGCSIAGATDTIEGMTNQNCQPTVMLTPVFQRNPLFSQSSPQLNFDVENEKKTPVTLPRRGSLHHHHHHSKAGRSIADDQIYDNLPEPHNLPPRPPRSARLYRSTKFMHPSTSMGAGGGGAGGHSNQVTFEDEHQKCFNYPMASHHHAFWPIEPSPRLQPAFLRCANCAAPVSASPFHHPVYYPPAPAPVCQPNHCYCNQNYCPSQFYPSLYSNTANNNAAATNNNNNNNSSTSTTSNSIVSAPIITPGLQLTATPQRSATFASDNKYWAREKITHA